MNKILCLLIVLCLVSGMESVAWNCTRDEAAAAFKLKEQLNPIDILPDDPYLNCNSTCQQEVEDYLHDNQTVCGYKYEDNNKHTYTLQTFPNKEQAGLQGYQPTHLGHCGACSSFQDLAVYLAEDLTDPIADCALEGFISLKWQTECIMKTGFTRPCAQIWAYDSNNTRRQCKWVCIWWKLIKQAPPNLPDGSLNPCIQCDEDQSGPIFKYYAARTRRSSGIISEIKRPNNQVYDINQCYY